MRRNKRCLSDNGFSLIEVAMALALFSFAIVGLMSLLTTSIITHKRAMSDTVLTQITQHLTAEVQMSDSSQFSSYNNKQWYFDNEGSEVSQQQATGVIYRAKTLVTSVQLSGASAASNSLQLVKIYAVFDPNGTVLNNLGAQSAPSGVIVVNQPPSVTVGP